MTTVNRRDFIPDVVWPFDTETDTYGSAVDRATAPEAWDAVVSADVPLVTQWDDGAHAGPEPGRIASSSASMPKAVATMVKAVGAAPGMRVLDVGTGTGYTAALLAEIVGPTGSVVSIEVDERLAETARDNLKRAGVKGVEVITGDGFRGWPAGAPYERIHVTCGMRVIPRQWVRQCEPGARIVMPWGTDYTPHDRLITLIVDDDGTASGRFGVGLSFMKMRAQRLRFDGHASYAPHGWMDSGRRSDSELTLSEARHVTKDEGAFAIGLRVPDCILATAEDDNGAVSIWLYSGRDRSVALAAFGPDTAPTIVQSGPRSLWDEVDEARGWWVARGQPEPERFGLTLRHEEERAWLDDPEGESWNPS
ncbi:methyltransferase domain-containing protein [Yinghuangia sp. ASG 101]|uniref:methyltransferase domain-containing protein n=1 Tax=Yinghuangia sp. ASG 101 TaxID=2896848 RepID=UPI001E2CB614|nr:methyltransferase domain-containing protein [Yinghuangia sp. ASG 101]UGQ14447.1 methyltransferase domain-containing protein [Yinghuangia sp. ASG 101]